MDLRSAPMPVSLGVHLGQQNLEMDQLRALWRRFDETLDWISAWDHFYEAPPQGGTVPHFEAIATLAALACETSRARIGCLVFYVGYRNPGQLAKAVTTLDHLTAELTENINTVNALITKDLPDLENELRSNKLSPFAVPPVALPKVK